jgi:hypothetical protein
MRAGNESPRRNADAAEKQRGTAAPPRPGHDSPFDHPILPLKIHGRSVSRPVAARTQPPRRKYACAAMAPAAALEER